MYKPIKLSEIPGRSVAESLTDKDVREFMETSLVATEITVLAKKSPQQVKQSYWRAAKRQKAPVKIMLLGDRIFMVKEAALK